MLVWQKLEKHKLLHSHLLPGTPSASCSTNYLGFLGWQNFKKGAGEDGWSSPDWDRQAGKVEEMEEKGDGWEMAVDRERERLKSERGKTAAGEGRQRSSRRKLKVRVHGSIRNPVSCD